MNGEIVIYKMASTGEEALRENYMQEFEMTYKDEEIFREFAKELTKEELIEWCLRGVEYMCDDEVKDFKETMFVEFIENHKRGDLLR